MSPTSPVAAEEYFFVIMESRLDARGTTTVAVVLLVRHWLCAEEMGGKTILLQFLLS